MTLNYWANWIQIVVGYSISILWILLKVFLTEQINMANTLWLHFLTLIFSLQSCFGVKRGWNASSPLLLFPVMWRDGRHYNALGLSSPFNTPPHERWSNMVNQFGSKNWIWIASPLLFLFVFCSYKGRTLQTPLGERSEPIPHGLCLGGYLC